MSAGCINPRLALVCVRVCEMHNAVMDLQFMTADTPTAKAEAIRAFFISVFSHESTENFEL